MNIYEIRNHQPVTERRLTPRVEIKVTLHYTIHNFPYLEGGNVNTEPLTDITRTKNLSELGVFFTCGYAINPGNILDIKLRLPIQPIYLKGRAVFCKELGKNLIYGVGAEFVGLQDIEKKLLREYLQMFLKTRS